MPYAVFIVRGYANHGTPEANWGDLFTTVLRGCIRLLPDQGKKFNLLARENRRRGVWATIKKGP